MKNFTLTKKIELTADVFELHFECSEDFEIKPGQFVTFILPKIGGRAYSILEQNWNKTILIIKRVNEENGWRWGSIFICDSQIWDVLNWVWPAGHFVLKETDNNKLFIWTWTGLVPLYNQIIAGLERWDIWRYTFIFWVRTREDLFYLDQFSELTRKYKNFSCGLYLSREESDVTEKWYVTDFLIEKNTSQYDEAYICWMPVMVDSAVDKLQKSGMKKESIFSEKY